MTEKTPYKVTERAGRRVSGERPDENGIVRLNAAQAAEPLRRGEIVREGKELSTAFTQDSPKLAALRARAAGLEPEAEPEARPAPPKRKAPSKPVETDAEGAA